MASKLAINDPVQTGSTLLWQASIKYNQFFDSYQRLRNEARDNVKIYFMPKKILFTDGTIKEYNDQ